MIPFDQWTNAVDFARSGTLFAHSQLHGEDHWRAVASQGLFLAEACDLGEEGRLTAALFGLFHDCRRINDGWDEHHGARAAGAFLEWSDGTHLSGDFRAELALSMVQHDQGHTTDNKLRGLGWDADRSTLFRVGVEPLFHFFSVVPEQRFGDFIEEAVRATTKPPTWDEIYESVFTGKSLSQHTKSRKTGLIPKMWAITHNS